MAAPTAIVELVRRFREHHDVYTSGAYNETQLRCEFLDPFFEALGWDVFNKQGFAEAYIEVKREDAIKVGAFTKAPDYCFRVGGTRKFFVEAKKPSVNVKDDLAPAFQVRRYAWSAKLPLSILTDFEEFAVYDCRIKPDKNDKASTARILYFTYTEFETRWDEVASVFSKDAVLKGSFDKYAQAAKGKKGTAEVDAAFLHEIEGWREVLARNIALRNSQLSQRELNFAVQQTIDRIIFLRICEDRGMEAEGRLAATTNGANVYKRLCDLFRLADDKYNSGLFHFSKETGRDLPDHMTLDLEIDDKTLKDIIKGLYYPDCPYEFSVISSDILGQVYEQFLGKVIRLTDGHRAVVEDKPEVKKAGGVYYTPTYIVDYIVKNTVGKLLGDQGNRVQGPGARVQGKGGEHNDEFENVQRIESLAESDGACGRGLHDCDASSTTGAIRAQKPDVPGGGVNTSQYSGGLRTDAQGGLPASSINSNGIADGTGNSPGDFDPVKIPQGSSTGKGKRTGGRNKQDAHKTYTVAQKTQGLGYNAQVLNSLTPSPSPLSPKLKTLTPREASHLRILDPACGSGSFLIGAYQYLLDWHLEWYAANGPEKWATGKNPAIYRVQGSGFRVQDKNTLDPRPYPPNPSSWKLTLDERKRILLDNIYGVDIDPQAVEVTKLSLLLKVLEGESEQTVSGKQKLLHTRVLPDLDRNIKCGNSLTGPDFYSGKQIGLFNDEERLRINVFDWKAEFPEIMKAGGFDAVIGNPPYVRQESLGNQKEYFKQHYNAFDGVADLYVYFMEKGVRLLRPNGIFGIIVSSSFLRTRFAAPLRNYLKGVAGIDQIIDFGGLPVFTNAKDTYVCIPILHKSNSRDFFCACEVKDLGLSTLQEFVKINSYIVSSNQLNGEAWSLKDRNESALFAKVMAAGVPLGVYVEKKIFYGIKTGLNEAFVISSVTKEALLKEDMRSAELIKPLLGGEDIRRCLLHPKEQWIIFTRRGVDINKYPAIKRHLSQWQSDLMPKKSKDDKKGRKPGRYQWYEIQDDVAYYNIFDEPKIIFPDIAKGPRFMLDTKGYYLTNTAYCIGLADFYLLGILNSRLFWFAISNISIPFGVRAGQYRYRLIYQYMEKVPIRTIDFSDRADKARHDRMVDMVEQMLALNKQLAATNTAHEKTALRRQIDATDRQIDQLVYELYGLTDEEIKIVEGQ